MEAIASIPAPSPTIASNGQTLHTRAGADHAFAPSLAHAVANRNKKEGHDYGKSSPKTTEPPLRKTPEGQTKRDTDQPGQITTKADQKEKPSSSRDDKTTDKSSTDASSGVDAHSESASKNKAADPSLVIAGGTSGYLSTPKEDILFSDLQTAIPRSVSLQDPSPRSLAAPLTDSLPLEKQDGLNVSRDAFGWKLDSINGGAVTGTISQGNQDQSMVSPDTGKNTNQTGVDTGQNTLMAAQLQKILSANGAEMSIVQQPAPQHQATGLNSLSGPLLTNTGTSAQQTPPNSDLAAGAVIASLSKESQSGAKKIDNHPTRLENNHPEFSVKADVAEPKITPKSQDMETLLQDTSDHKETSLAALTSSTNTAENSQQAGQFSFGSIFTQNLQGAQHTAGTTGSTGSYAAPLWTPSQENALIGQVLRGFHNNSSTPTSKLILKLYPEELGELKIDLQMKDGAIKANLFTHSDQVQQVLEKYIPKLRSLMEQQGLTVDDIFVTNTSGNVDGHKLFQEDFANNHDFSQPGKSAKAATFTDLTFEKVFSQTSDTVSGVNVTI